MISLRYKETAGILPTSVFDVMKDEKVVGMVQVRHQPSAGTGVPTECKSHIYYEILLEERGHGYGNEAFRLALSEAKKLSINPIVATCRETNGASRKIIEKNGGTETGSCRMADGGSLLRYEFRG